MKMVVKQDTIKPQVPRPPLSVCQPTSWSEDIDWIEEEEEADDGEAVGEGEELVVVALLLLAAVTVETKRTRIVKDKVDAEPSKFNRANGRLFIVANVESASQLLSQRLASI
jgi:hypothetical protein